MIKSRIFDRFFNDVNECVSLMKKYDIIVSESAMLHALFQSVNWKFSDLDLFVDQKSFQNKRLLNFHHYLVKERYKLSKEKQSEKYDSEKVHILEYYDRCKLIKIKMLRI